MTTVTLSYTRANATTTSQYGSRLDLVIVEIDDDGSVTTRAEDAPGRVYDVCPYMLFREDVANRPAPTDAQRAVLAMWWSRRNRLPGASSPNGPVCQWAFAGSTPDEINAKHGDGGKVILNGPSGDPEPLENPLAGTAFDPRERHYPEGA